MRVLIVDDEKPIRDLYQDALSSLPLIVQAVGDVPDAKVLLMNTPFDLVISDINMPEGSGIELLKWARTHFPGIKFGIVTGSAHDIGMDHLYSLSLDFLLEKPVEIHTFLKTVRSTLGI
jgi:DNA-binding NtrC family response regulator